MFGIHCEHCTRRYLVGTRSIIEFANTTTGPVAKVRCPHDHENLHHFRTGSTVSAEPQEPTEVPEPSESTAKHDVVAV